MANDETVVGRFRHTVLAHVLRTVAWCVLATVAFWCLGALSYMALALLFFRYSLMHWPAITLWWLAVFAVAASGPLFGAFRASEGQSALRWRSLAASVIGVIAGLSLRPSTTMSVEMRRFYMTENPLREYYEAVNVAVAVEFVIVVVVMVVAQCVLRIGHRRPEAGEPAARDGETLAAESVESQQPKHPRANLLLGLRIATTVTILVAAFTWWAVQHTAVCLQDKMCRAALARLAVAVRGYAKAEGCLPPAYGPDDVSWRVRVLPFIVLDHVSLDYPQEVYNRKRPWDSEDNEWLLKRSFHGKYTFCCLARRDAWNANATSYVAVVGEETFWPGRKARCLDDTTPEIDGKILFVEVPHPDIPWTKPQDIGVDEAVELYRDVRAGKCRRHAGGLYYVTLGGTVAPLGSIPSEETFRRMLRAPGTGTAKR